MSSLPTLPKRTWLERLTVAVEGLLVALCLATVFAWLGRIDRILLPLGGSETFKMNSALAYLSLGAVLLALEFRLRRFAWAAFGATALAVATLLQQAAGVDLRIDEFFVRDHIVKIAGHAGRMPVISALCLLFGSLALAWHATTRFARARQLTSVVIGSLIASVGFSTLVGYAARLPAVIRWGSGNALAPVAAVALLLFGLALISIAWRDSLSTEGEAPAWSPMPVVIGCLTLTVILWIGLRQDERAYVGVETVNTMERLAMNVQRELDNQTNTFERMAGRAANSGTTNPVLWEADARTLWHNSRDNGCRAIEYLDADGRTVWIFPKDGHEGAAGFDHHSIPERHDALIEAAQRLTPVVSRTTKLLSALRNESGLIIYAPVQRGNAIVGYVAAHLAYQPLFDAIINAERIAERYHVTASILGVTVYESGQSVADLDPQLTNLRTYPIKDRRMQLALTPLPHAIRERRYLPELALLAGFGITALWGLSVHLARRARAGQRAAEHSNRRLFAENEERRRVEARLKVSDERLRLALDSTQIGIFEWSVAAGHVYYSPGLWAMLGYDHTRMPSTVEAWQSLIHPDDLAQYRRRVDAQLSGSATFIDPEYRVRARNGDWRWVYSRSKAVALGGDGRPVRIVGSLQDITARREAELALRESQAEARKLSLVAAKTDNPVLITSPDGRIEWANEAFCRVMEYALDEVVGKNPEHFMVGPETNPRTLGEIRAAMARGDGISTDIVNYSKSGRKFHLHIEVQPVHSATGVLENFIAVETDITARVETEHQLRRAKAEADDASRAKSEFLASMSHEIRTPMNGVIGMTSLLMETVLTSEQRDYVNTIRTSGEALLTIINDILDFSKIESGKMELEHSPLELAICIEEALDLFALQAAAKRLEIGYHVAPDVPAWIIGDVTRLRQVLVNLVNNAVKFTPSGSISLEIRRQPQASATDGGADDAGSGRMMLEFAVRDTGIGIPPERVDRLFKAFSQVDSSTTRKFGGTGLGLAICQRLTQLMGGDIHVESTPGHGSSFVFTLATEAAPTPLDSGLRPVPTVLREGVALCIEDHPVTQKRLAAIFDRLGVRHVIVPDAPSALAVAATMPQPPTVLVVDGGDIEGAVPLEAITGITCPRLIMFPFGQTAPVAQPNGPAVASVSKPLRTGAFLHALLTLFETPAAGLATLARPADRAIGDEIPLEVLLAEDNPVNQKVALRFLERLGYRADAVANGLEAVTAVENRRYDLVLMDLQMPEMDGFEATRQIRARLSLDRQPKIVALTANAMQGDRELCVAAGMDDYISKPVKMHEIAAAIRRHFDRTPEPTEAQQDGG